MALAEMFFCLVNFCPPYESAIALDPIVNIPEREIWLGKNQSALSSLKQGLEEAQAGETQDYDSFAKYAGLDITK